MGDSLNRGLFYTLSTHFSGWHPTKIISLEQMVMKEEGIFPLLGEHKGPVSDSAIGTKLETYHNNKLLCCGNKRIGDDRCHYAIQNEDKFPSYRTRKYNDHLFHDISEYIETFIAPGFGHEEFMCMSFIWAPKFHDAADQLDHLYDDKKFKYQPDALIMNMNMHQCKLTDEEMEAFENRTSNLFDNTRGTKPVVLYHAPSALDKTHPKFGSHCTNTDFLKIMDLFQQKMKHGALKFITKYLNFFQESIRAHKMDCSDDGVHFTVRCSHMSTMLFWDFNWLKKLGVIKADSL